MYTYVVTGCTLTLLLDVQTENVQPRATECIKTENVQTGDIQNLEMYNHVLPNVQPRATECTKKSFSKPINIGSSFEDLDARILNMKTVRNLDQRF